MIEVNAMGDGCPIPVVKTKKALDALTAPDTIVTLVDNTTAVQNLTKFAQNRSLKVESEQLGEKEYKVTIEVTEENMGGEAKEEIVVLEDCGCEIPAKKNHVVVIASDHMGEGDLEFGKTLLKGFIYALSQQDRLPDTILFYNSGAYITTEGSASLEDLKELESKGVKIMTCGACLDYYKLKEKLAVGEVTNMYVIVETMTQADLIIRP